MDLQGKLILEGGQLVGDQTTRIIEHLVAFHLIRIAVRESGWAQLYYDPADGRYWERSFPDSHLHGGGAPTLKSITAEVAIELYGKEAISGAGSPMATEADGTSVEYLIDPQNQRIGKKVRRAGAAPHSGEPIYFNLADLVPGGHSG
jgi:hypothetical protein